jgi:O-acetyl-ADP-ribose deacetylase
VIHAVGPVYQPNNPKIVELLSSAYRRSLEVAVAHQIKTIAFPAISTGVYSYPLDDAAHIALTTVKDFVQKNTDLKLVRFVLFSQSVYDVFRKVLLTLEN